MADVRLYIDGQMVLPDVGKDMLSMTGWTDSADIKYCTKDKNSGKFIPRELVLDCDRYIGYFGDDDVTLAISRNRNLTMCVNVKTFQLDAPGYDYFARTYYFSNVYTELSLPDIELEVHKLDDDWMHLSWNYSGYHFEADISTYL